MRLFSYSFARPNDAEPLISKSQAKKYIGKWRTLCYQRFVWAFADTKRIKAKMI